MARSRRARQVGGIGALAGLVVSVGLAAPAFGDQAECDVVVAAFSALAQVPDYRQIVAMPDGQTTEMAAVGDIVYLKLDGTWTKIPLKPGGRKGIMEQIIGTAPLENCRPAEDDSIDGVVMRVIDYRVPAIKGLTPNPSDQRVWIGTDGLPHRMTTPEGMKAEITYGNAEPPIP